MVVDVVRDLGLGISMHQSGTGRFGFCQGQFMGVAVRAVPASQRANSCLRVGVLRFESSDARVGLLGRLSKRETAHRQSGHGVSGKMSTQAADELCMVGESR